MNFLKEWFLCHLWYGGMHDWTWKPSINEKKPSRYECARCGKVG